MKTVAVPYVTMEALGAILNRSVESGFLDHAESQFIMKQAEHERKELIRKSEPEKRTNILRERCRFAIRERYRREINELHKLRVTEAGALRDAICNARARSSETIAELRGVFYIERVEIEQKKSDALARLLSESAAGHASKRAAAHSELRKWENALAQRKVDLQKDVAAQGTMLQETVGALKASSADSIARIDERLTDIRQWRNAAIARVREASAETLPDLLEELGAESMEEGGAR